MSHSFDVHSANLRRSASALLVALGLLCALCIFFVFEVADLRRTLRELRDNDLVRIDTRNILVDLLDAEMGQRGFLLTGDPKLLEQYQRGRNHVGERIRRSREDGTMDEHLKGDAAQIMLLADSGLEELARTVALKRQGHDAAALDVVKGGYGNSQMSKARQLIQTNLEQLRLARDRLLEDLNRRIQRSAVLLVLILGTVAGLALHAWRSLSTSARLNNELAAHLAQEASHDALTGLPNRRFFHSWARQLVGKSQRDQSCFTLLLIDLDGFKKVNDTLGHATGDEVLKLKQPAESPAAKPRQSVMEQGSLEHESGRSPSGAVERAANQSDRGPQATKATAMEQQAAKLRLVHDVAKDVWGEL